MRSWYVAALLAINLPTLAVAQTIIAKPDREEFEGVEYVGGDATQPKKLYGWLVLTDSTLSIHDCSGRREYCGAKEKGNYYKPEPLFTIDLRRITSVESSSDVRGANAGSKILVGALAGDRKEEFVGLTYETKSSAEAPIFKTQKAQSAALEAKIRYRMKKLGVALSPSTP